jgi:phospholipid transport system substrate-binding protein
VLCTLPTAVKASVDTSREDGRPQRRSVKVGVRPDPIDELERAERTIEGLVSRSVPDWSPEADAIEWEVDSILARLLDYEQIARNSLGADWDLLTADQRSAFVRALSGLTNHAFVSAMTRTGVQLRFGSETVLGPKASVMVTARVSGRTPELDQQIEYRLNQKQGRWLIYDVLVDGTGLLDGYRAQFARMIQRDGAARLIDRLQRKLEVSGRY